MAFMEGDFSAGFDVLGSFAKSQYPYTMYSVTNTSTTTTTTTSSLTFSTSQYPNTIYYITNTSATTATTITSLAFYISASNGRSPVSKKTTPKPKSTTTRSIPSSTSVATSTLGRSTEAAWKQLSPEAKHQRLLERKRLTAAKSREKKRLQNLKTITDADEIIAKNQALHKSLDELQEEVRMLKNQILCHRDYGCDIDATERLYCLQYHVA
ncbi:hypothetical protein BG005_001523 [Podila minutissima]|nr:hypothetical protein BG005_001523 [Podila minutissima]